MSSSEEADESSSLSGVEGRSLSLDRSGRLCKCLNLTVLMGRLDDDSALGDFNAEGDLIDGPSGVPSKTALSLAPSSTPSSFAGDVGSVSSALALAVPDLTASATPPSALDSRDDKRIFRSLSSRVACSLALRRAEITSLEDDFVMAKL